MRKPLADFQGLYQLVCACVKTGCLITRWHMYVLFAGVLVSIALSWVPHHRIALTSLLSIVTVLLMVRVCFINTRLHLA